MLDERKLASRKQQREMKEEEHDDDEERDHQEERDEDEEEAMAELRTLWERREQAYFVPTEPLRDNDNNIKHCNDVYGGLIDGQLRPDQLGPAHIVRCTVLLLDDDDLELNVLAFLCTLRLACRGFAHTIDSFMLSLLRDLAERSTHQLPCLAVTTMLALVLADLALELSPQEGGDWLCEKNLLASFLPQSCPAFVPTDLVWSASLAWAGSWRTRKEGCNKCGSRLSSLHMIHADAAHLARCIDQNPAEHNISDMQPSQPLSELHKRLCELAALAVPSPAQPGADGDTTGIGNGSRTAWRTRSSSAHFAMTKESAQGALATLWRIVWVYFEPLADAEVEIAELQLALAKGIRLQEAVPDCM